MDCRVPGTRCLRRSISRSLPPSPVGQPQVLATGCASDQYSCLSLARRSATKDFDHIPRVSAYRRSGSSNSWIDRGPGSPKWSALHARMSRSPRVRCLPRSSQASASVDESRRLNPILKTTPALGPGRRRRRSNSWARTGQPFAAAFPFHGLPLAR